MYDLVSDFYLKYQDQIESGNIGDEAKKDVLDYICRRFKEEKEDLEEGLYNFYYLLLKYKYNIDEYQIDDDKMTEIFITLADVSANDCRAYFLFADHGLIDDLNMKAYMQARKDLNISEDNPIDEDMFHIIEDDYCEEFPEDPRVSSNQLNSILQLWCKKYAKTKEATEMFGEWTDEEERSYVFWN